MTRVPRAPSCAVVRRVRASCAPLVPIPTGRPGRVPGTYEKSIAGLPYVAAYARQGEDVVVLRLVHTARNWPSGRWPD